MDWTQLFICITGLAGHLLIARQDRRGYWFWSSGNAAIIRLSVVDGHFGMAGLFVVYTVISLKALRDWGQKTINVQEAGASQSPGQNRKPPESTSNDLLRSFGDGLSPSTLCRQYRSYLPCPSSTTGI